MSNIKCSSFLTLVNVGETFSVILTNEAQQFATSSSRTVVSAMSFHTDIIVYRGAKQITDYTIGTINSANGITVSKTASQITFSVASGTTLGADSGTFTIPITIKNQTINKIFSWSCAKQGVTGNTGISAKSVNVTATSQVFKSTDGGLTFTPENIKLTPVFQGGIHYSKWQYSIDGGSSFTDVSSGAGGLTITSGTLTIAKSCSLYTDNITSVSFKCIGSDTDFYDVITVLKLYDVTDIKFGIRNLLLDSGTQITSANYLMKVYSASSLKSNQKYTLVLKGTVSAPNRFGIFCNDGSINIGYFPTGQKDAVEHMTFTTPNTLTNSNISICNYPSASIQTATISWAALYEGEIIPPSDWLPAPEDAESHITQVTADLISTQTTVTTLGTDVNNLKKEITTKVTQSDITNAIKGIQPDLTDANKGRDKWLVEIYPKSSLPDNNHSSTTIEAFFSTGVTPTYTYELSDKNLSVSLAYGDNYLGYAKTCIYFNTPYTWSSTFAVEDMGSVYLNAALTVSAENSAAVPISLSFKAGWNVIEVVWNETTGGDGFKFDSPISSLAQCALMNYEVACVTAREKKIKDTTVESKVNLEGIQTTVAQMTSTILTKADGTVVNTLSEKINETISTIESFKRTVSETYVTNTHATQIESTIEQLSDSIKNRVTADQLEAAINLSKNAWKADFSENGAVCGSILLNKNGISVSGASGSGYKTTITSSEFSGWYNEQKVFWLNQDETVTERLRIEKGADFRTIKLVPAMQSNYKGIDFLSGNAII